MDWELVNHDTGTPLNGRRYLNEVAAKHDLVRLGETFSRLYMAVPVYLDPNWHRVLTEGFAPGDLDGILLPQFSVDVYVPGDSGTDNLVVGFLIKGVPEAVFPFKNFCSYSRGVKHVDYGDSDTLPHTSIVYVEYDRSKFDARIFDELVQSICRLARMTPDDFSVGFPNTSKTYPYSVERIEKYFRLRDEQKNRLAQLAAVQGRRKEIHRDLEKQMQDGTIGQHLNGTASGQSPQGRGGWHSLRRGVHPAGGRPISAKPPKAEINDAVKTMVVNDAKRNLASHTETWEQFDNRWASRLRITPSRISSIRKRIYDR